MADKFQLTVRVEVIGTDEYGGYTGERLSINQEYRLPASGFSEIAAILGRFHDLAEKVKEDVVVPVV